MTQPPTTRHYYPIHLQITSSTMGNVAVDGSAVTCEACLRTFSRSAR